ncbi:MAG: 4-(cytidine 5'-diphospho)-2-C-methyl-D-erythritol kinase [bacterium]
MNSLTLPSYAKINLGLNILGKREDGFHEIETILQQIDLRDEIELSPREGPEVAFRCDQVCVPGGENNLCVRAATMLKAETGVRKGIAIHLNKRIPMGAGLGGGSSNAAMVLLGLNKLWQLNLRPPQLTSLASRLGSDVPFFIQGGTALAVGKGDVLVPGAVLENHVVLVVYPGFEISTSWAYGQINLNLTISKKNIKLRNLMGKKIDCKILRELANDFEVFVFKRFPVLASIKERLLASNATLASLSGSGSTVYGVFQNEHEALEAQEVYKNKYTTFITRPIKWGYCQMS